MTALLPTELTESEMRADLEQYHDSNVEAVADLESKRRDQSVNVKQTRDRLPGPCLIQHNETRLRIAAQSSLRFHCRKGIRKCFQTPYLDWLANSVSVKPDDLHVKVDGKPVNELLRPRVAITTGSPDQARRTIAGDRTHWSSSSTVELGIEHRDRFSTASFNVFPVAWTIGRTLIL